MNRLVVVLGDQLSNNLASLQLADPLNDHVVMAEVREEATYVPHHPKKIILVFSAMRHFCKALRARGWTVDYYSYDDGCSTILEAVQRSAAARGSSAILITQPGEWRLVNSIREQWSRSLSLPVHMVEDDRFLCRTDQFQQWAAGKKQLRMEYFYREMRKRTGLLMNADLTPVGGQWNFDAQNRERYRGTPTSPALPAFVPDQITQDVISLVSEVFNEHFGDPLPFHYAVTREQALQALDHFVEHRLPWFGDYQDAMSLLSDTLFHSLLSPYLNLGLLSPLEVCERAEQAWQAGDAPINAVEGFIRQIIGWREYVRGIYWLKMPDYLTSNALHSQAPLPDLYWGKKTDMLCLSEAVRATRQHAHAHHIQRLMVTGNFALLLGVDVIELHHWYLAVYADAYEWVELPNTLGMVMHADGGLLGSKPYAASGKYIDRMSDYCGQCPYNLRTADENNSCPFNTLYWHFIDRHKARFEAHPRMSMIYRTWEKMAEEKRNRIIARGDWLIAHSNTL
jgi:deoxyribodipyrimidine photolyase-related protein